MIYLIMDNVDLSYRIGRIETCNKSLSNDETMFQATQSYIILVLSVNPHHVSSYLQQIIYRTSQMYEDNTCNAATLSQLVKNRYNCVIFSKPTVLTSMYLLVNSGASNRTLVRPIDRVLKMRTLSMGSSNRTLISLSIGSSWDLVVGPSLDPSVAVGL